MLRIVIFYFFLGLALRSSQYPGDYRPNPADLFPGLYHLQRRRGGAFFLLEAPPATTFSMGGLRARVSGRPNRGGIHPDDGWIRKHRLLDLSHPDCPQRYQHSAGHAANRIESAAERFLYRGQRLCCGRWHIPNHPNYVCAQARPSACPDRDKFYPGPNDNKSSSGPGTFAAVAPFLSL